MTNILYQQTSTPTERLFAEQRRARLARLHVVQKPVASVVREIVEVNQQSQIQNQIAEAAETIRLAFADRVAIVTIKRVVADHFEISQIDLISNRRFMCWVWPRMLAIYIAKTLTPFSFPEIGRQFGGRDHTTVLHAVRRVTNEIAKDEPTKLLVETLIERVRQTPRV